MRKAGICIVHLVTALSMLSGAVTRSVRPCPHHSGDPSPGHEHHSGHAAPSAPVAPHSSDHTRESAPAPGGTAPCTCVGTCHMSSSAPLPASALRAATPAAVVAMDGAGALERLQATPAYLIPFAIPPPPPRA